MDAKRYLGDYVQKAHPFYVNFFTQEKKRAEKIDKELATALTKLQDYMDGGKKVRAGLTVLGYEIAGRRDFKKILPVSFGVELMHNGIVIHDDFIDLDEERRGKPTVHKVLAQQYSKHYGHSMAIIVADLTFFLAQKIIAQSKFSAIRKNEALASFNQFLVNTAYGQILDLYYDQVGATWQDVVKTRKYKTADYTFSLPLSIGAILGGASKSVLKAIKGYSENVGIAFQIQDDILGVFGDPKVTGKSNESDIRGGKRTLLYFKALELATQSDCTFFKKQYGSIKIDKKAISRIKTIMIESGSLAYSQKFARKLVNKGKLYIPKITKDPGLQEILSTFANYMIERKK